MTLFDFCKNIETFKIHILNRKTIQIGTRDLIVFKWFARDCSTIDNTFEPALVSPAVRYTW